MVENLAGSPGMCSDGPGSALIKNPKRELFSLSEARRREEGTSFGGGGEGLTRSISTRGLGPTRARHGRTVCDTPADSPRGARTVRAPSVDGPLLLPE
jgi:hypothetical protein